MKQNQPKNTTPLSAMPFHAGKITSTEDAIDLINSIKSSQSLNNKLSHTSETATQYIQQSKRIINLIQNDAGEFNITYLIDWLTAKIPTIRYSTFRFYRAALTFYLLDIYISHPDPDYLYAAQAIASMKFPSDKKRIPQAAALKRKRIPEGEMNLILQELQSNKGLWAQAALLYLPAALATGLRPCEWEHTSIKQKDPQRGIIISVENAKATNGRGTGEIRELFIPNAWGAEHVELFIDFVSAWVISTKKPYSTLQKMLYRALSKSSANALGQKNKICLYSTRHQFSANAKNIFSRHEVALLLGHNIIKTAAKHYGKKIFGWENFIDMRIKNLPAQEVQQKSGVDVAIKRNLL